MCIYIAMITTVLSVMLWHADSTVALKCNGYGLESWLAGHLEKGCVHWRGPGKRMYAVVYTGKKCTVWGSANFCN